MSLQKSTQLLAFAILIATVQATRFSFDRGLCQRLGNEALHGCPKSTLRVGPHAEFQHIQDAIDSISDRPDPFVILVEPGNYTEQLNITRAGSLWLLGVTDSPNDRTKNSVNVIWHNATGTATTGTYDNAYTSTLTIAPNFNASLTGTGPTGFDVPPDTPFGNIDFRTYNLNFINDYLPYAAGPSLALSISYANGGFYYTRFLSYQDTVYVGKLGNAYMYESEVAGQTDFFYGFGTCWITDSLVSLRGCGGGITAWKGTNTTFENKYGIYIHDSVVQKANSSLAIEGQCALGRPWNPQHRSIFANCYLDNSIQASGYIQWSTADPRVNQNTSMAEYRDFGPGYDAAGRVAASNVSIRLTKEQYAPFATVSEVFQFPSGGFGNTAWIDRHPRA